MIPPTAGSIDRVSIPPATMATGEELYLAHAATIESAIRFVVIKNQLRPEEADEFAAEVKLRLVDNDYRMLRSFQGRSSWPTYLRVVVRNCWTDVSRRLWGKFHASAEAERLGQLAMEIEKLLARDGLSLKEALGELQARHPDVPAAEIERLAARLPPRAPRRLVGDEPLASLPAPADAAADGRALKRESFTAKKRALQILQQELAGLSQEDRLLVGGWARGVQIADLARSLGTAPKPLYKRWEGIRSRLRKELERKGIRFDELRDVLGSDEP